MRAIKSHLLYLLLAAAVAVAVSAPLSAVALLAPDVAARHFAEDAAIEMLTALAFLSAAAIGTVALVRKRRVEFWMAVAIAFGVFAGFDELSFGERLLGWEPYVAYDVRLDGLHDLLQLTRRFMIAEFDQPYLAAAALLIAILAAGVVAARIVLARARRQVTAAAADPSAMLLLGAAGMVAAAQVLDVKLAPLRHPLIRASYIEEHLELSAGLVVLMFVCLRVWAGAARGAGERPDRPEDRLPVPDASSPEAPAVHGR